MKSKLFTMKNTATRAARTLQRLWAVALAFALVTLPQTALASGALGESSIAKGTEKLLADATTWLMIIVPAVTVLVVIYYLIHRAAADEMEHSVATRCRI